jgi:hypothetical protein
MLKTTVAACVIAAAAAMLVLQAPRAANATTLTYNVTLTPFCPSGCGPENGTGTFTIVLPPDTLNRNSGNLTQANGGLVSMDFHIDGEDFAINSSAVIGYNYNSLSLSSFQINNIGYSGTIGSTELTGISLGGYYFQGGTNGSLDTNGSLSIALAPTPLPAALPLFAGGLGMLGLFGRRRKRTAAQASAAA